MPDPNQPPLPPATPANQGAAATPATSATPATPAAPATPASPASPTSPQPAPTSPPGGPPPAAVPHKAPGGQDGLLPAKTKQALVRASVLVALISVIYGLFTGGVLNRDMRLSGDDYKQLTTFFDDLETKTNHDTYFRTHVVDLHVSMLRIANEQGLKSLAMGMAMAIVAIGFALFVLGVDSAFEVSAEKKDMGSAVVRASAPGVLCFVLAAIMVTVVVTSGSELSIGSSALPSPPMPMCDNADAFVKMMSRPAQAPPGNPGAASERAGPPAPPTPAEAEKAKKDGAAEVDSLVKSLGGAK